MELFQGRNNLSWVVVVLAVLFSGAALAATVTAVERPNASANLPAGAESARAAALSDRLSDDDVVPALVVLDRDGAALTAADRTAITGLARTLGPLAATGQQVFPAFADDGRAALVGVPLDATTDEEAQAARVADLREAVSTGLPDGLRAQVTGGPAFAADLGQVFDGADVWLLATTAGVVALLLLLTYRSPWLWLVPLSVIGVADQVAAKALAVGTHVFGFEVDGATVGITSVLVFGAGTNYALLLIARYREELRREPDRFVAMRIAWRQAAPAILASSGTVVLALLCLGFASSPFSTAIGYAGAIGIVTAVLYALFVLPAAMTLFGRGLFWPFVPRVGDRDPSRHGVWARVARRVTARPVVVSVAGAAVLVALALPLLGVRTGLAQTEQFRVSPESVTGQRVLAAHFPAGASQPTTVLVAPSSAAAVGGALERLDGVRSVERTAGDDELTELSVVLIAEPASGAALADIHAVRAAARAVDSGALVGGADAEALDAKTAAQRDQRVVIPLILAVVLVVLLLLLRSVVASVLLVLTVVATYVASMGASWFAFTHWFGFPALDLGVPLLAFLFLVALGVDYNIFLVTRAREEAAGHDTRTAISTALAVTGGVITSAGVLLAAVFTVLGVLPLITLTQLGVVVGFGVLLDTLLVRSIVVPALVSGLGRRFWWPGRLSRHG